MEKLFKRMEEYKDNIFIKNDMGKSITYIDTINYAERVKKVIPERCFVFIFTKNTIGGVLNYVACIKNRIVPYLIDFNTNQKLVDNLLQIYKPKYIFIPTELVDTYSNYKIIHQEHEYSILKTNYNEKEDLYDELCMCVGTSGSTGDSKLVRLSYQNVLDNALEGIRFDSVKEIDKAIITMPINYSYVILIITSFAYSGATLLITERNIFENTFWDFFINEKISHFYGIPYHCEMLDKIGFFQKKYQFLKYITIGGGTLSKELYIKCGNYAQNNRLKIHIGYGQSESTCTITRLLTNELVEKIGSIGKKFSCENIYLIDEDGKTIETSNTDGELVVQGNNIALGYAKNRTDLSKGDDFKGILHTGDIACFDEDGYFYIKGRKSRFVKVYGKRVNLDHIEDLLKNKYSDLEIACVGIDNNIFVCTNNNSYINEIKDYISSTLKFNKKVVDVKYIAKIPRNESGKVLYSKLMELL